MQTKAFQERLQKDEKVYILTLTALKCKSLSEEIENIKETKERKAAIAKGEKTE